MPGLFFARFCRCNRRLHGNNSAYHRRGILAPTGARG
nr:MAG TPA: hypothetical protein [Caudoviricetes sp.]